MTAFDQATPARTLPQSSEAEKGVLCAMLIGGEDAIDKVAGESPDIFNIPAHRIVFSLLLELSGEKKPLDFITIAQTLEDRKQLDEIGGAAFVSQLFDFIPTAANIDYHLEILREKHIAREVILRCTKTIQSAYSGDSDARTLLSEAQNGLLSITIPVETVDRTMKEEVIDKLRRMEDGDPLADTIKTGIKWLDDNSPLRTQSYVEIAGKTKAGKSKLATTILCNTALNGVRSLFFTLETPRRKLVDNIFANVTGIPECKHYRKFMSEYEFARVKMSAMRLAQTLITIRDDVRDADDMFTTIKRHKKDHPDLKIVVIDYLQLVKIRMEKGQSRQQALAGLSRELRAISILCDIAFLILSQLNNEGNSYESASADQDCTAKWVMIRIVSKGDNGEEIEDHGKRMLSIPIQREGESGISTQITFLGHISKITDAAFDKTET